MIFAGSVQTLFSQTLKSQDVSKELDYIAGLVKKGASDGDMELIVKSYRTMSNLEIAVDGLQSKKDSALFFLAMGYNFVNICPTAIVLQLSETTNPTGFNFDCIERTKYYFDKAIKIASSENVFTPADRADIYFIVGIGYDRLKFNLANISKINSDKSYEKALNYLGKAAELGAGFEGIKTIMKRAEDDAYYKKPLIDDQQYNALNRMLYIDRALPQPEHEPAATKEDDTADSTPPIAAPSTKDENLYIDYQWRFMVKKPDDTWSFESRKAQATMRLTIQKKDTSSVAGSGLNIICRTLTDAEAKSNIEQLTSKSIDLLKAAGYDIKSQKMISFNGMQAQEIISTHQYQNLIQKAPLSQEKKDAEPPQNIISKQYMIIAVANNIQYIVSFNSLDSEYARIFPEYKMIANSVSFF